MKRLLNRFGWWLVKRTGGRPTMTIPPLVIDAKALHAAIWKEIDDRRARS